MSHLTLIKLMSHIDEALDITSKNNFNDDAQILEILSKRYHNLYQLTVSNYNGNS
jgi:hypothetical protein